MGIEEFGNEHNRAQEIITLEYNAMIRYFDVAGVVTDMRPEWIEQYGATLRKIAENEPEFLEEYNRKNEPSQREFEAKLQEYL